VKTMLLRVPAEPRFVAALVLAVGPADTLSFLLEVGALRVQDLTVVRILHEALLPAYYRASDARDNDQAHVASVLREALDEPDNSAYLAYQVQQASADSNAIVAALVEALAIIGAARAWSTRHQRPWTTTALDAELNDSAWWRDQVRRLLLLGPLRATVAQLAPAHPRSRRREPAPLVIEACPERSRRGQGRPLALPDGEQ